MSNWGQPNTLGLFADLSGVRAVGGTSPATADMVLESVSIYVHTHHTGQIRLAVYQGGSLAAGPAGASLIEDLGQTSGSGTATWLTVTSASKPALAASTVTWIAMKHSAVGAANVAYSNSPTGAGNFDTAHGRWASVSLNTSEAVAYPDPWPADAGSFLAAWYSLYLTYSISSGAATGGIQRSSCQSPFAHPERPGRRNGRH